MALVARVGDFAGGYLKGGEQAGGAISDIVVDWPFWKPGPDRPDRCGPVRGWTFVFSSTQTTAFSGGFRVKPTTSRTLTSSFGSVENLNVSRRQRCRFQSRQMRARTRFPIGRLALWLTSA